MELFDEADHVSVHLELLVHSDGQVGLVHRHVQPAENKPHAFIQVAWKVYELEIIKVSLKRFYPLEIKSLKFVQTGNGITAF